MRKLCDDNMAHWAKALASQTFQGEYKLWKPSQGGKR